MDNPLTTHLETPTLKTGFANETPSSKLNISEIFRMAWRSIRGNMTRSLLTALGVIIGVAAVIALTGIGGAVNKNINKQFADLGTDQLIISSNFELDTSQQTVSLEDAQSIRDVRDPRIAGVSPSVQKRMRVRTGDKKFDYTVVGAWADYAGVEKAVPAFGRFFNETEEATRQYVAVIGATVAKELFGGSEVALGQSLSIAGNSFEVVGVLENKATGFNNRNETLIVPLSIYTQRIGKEQTKRGGTAVSNLVVQARDIKNIKGLQADLQILMTSRHTNPKDFSIYNLVDQLNSLNNIMKLMQLFLGAIAGISLVVGGIGIMNIMLVSVTERTREIGIRKALGAKPRDILTQFLLESIVLSGSGGVVGVVVGLGIAIIASYAMGSLTFPIVGTAIAFSFAVIVGVFFGWYPARRAAALDPVESLRYE